MKLQFAAVRRRPPAHRQKRRHDAERSPQGGPKHPTEHLPNRECRIGRQLVLDRGRHPRPESRRSGHVRKHDLLKLHRRPQRAFVLSEEEVRQRPTSRARHHRCSAASVPFAIAGARLRAWRRASVMPSPMTNSLWCPASPTSVHPFRLPFGKNTVPSRCREPVHPAPSRRSTDRSWNRRPDRPPGLGPDRYATTWLPRPEADCR
jgi:hypothetical protein